MNEKSDGFLYASRRDVIQDPTPFGTGLTCGDVGLLHRSSFQDRLRRVPWVERPRLCWSGRCTANRLGAEEPTTPVTSGPSKCSGSATVAWRPVVQVRAQHRQSLLQVRHPITSRTTGSWPGRRITARTTRGDGCQIMWQKGAK